MKTTFLSLCRFSIVLGAVILAAAVLISDAFGQQVTVNFRNDQLDFPTPADRDVYAGSQLVPLVGTNFQARLLYGSDVSSLVPATYTTPARFRNVTTADPLAGTWSGANRTLTGFMPGQVTTLQVQVWDAGPGPTFRTFEEVRATGGFWCESAPFPYTIPSAGTSDPRAFYMDNLRSFCFIPEPSVVGLGICGLALLFLYKKHS